MKIKIAYDFDDEEYIAFVDKLPIISGYGKTEGTAILDLLYKARNENGFHVDVIDMLIEKIETNENRIQ